MTDPTTTPRLPREFYAACGMAGFNDASLRAFDDAPTEAVNMLLAWIEQRYDAPPRRTPLPPWTAAPGSPEGLAALAVIARGLGYPVIQCGHSWYRIPQKQSSGLSIIAFNDAQWTCLLAYDDWDVPWSDPTALPRLLHLMLALAPHPTPEGAPR